MSIVSSPHQIYAAVGGACQAGDKTTTIKPSPVQPPDDRGQEARAVREVAYSEH